MTATQFHNQALLPETRLASKIIKVTRDMSIANSTVAYTGVGFKPTAAVIFGGVNGALQNTVGAVDSALTGYSMQYSAANTWNFQDAYAIAIYSSASNLLLGNISSFDTDGFSINYGKVNTPSGTAQFYVLCFR